MVCIFEVHNEWHVSKDQKQNQEDKLDCRKNQEKTVDWKKEVPVEMARSSLIYGSTPNTAITYL
jgi:hypothetical protein